MLFESPNGHCIVYTYCAELKYIDNISIDLNKYTLDLNKIK